MLEHYYADMHIHIGRDKYNKPVKITASKTLTIENILKEASRRKGIHLIGVIDCQSPGVQEEIIDLIADGKAVELPDGGIRFEQVTLLLGAEIEVYDEHCQGPIHVLAYLPTIEAMQAFSKWLSERMKNISLSSQRYYGSAKELQYKVKELDGIFIPAHVFTPFKSVYGKGVIRSIEEILDKDLIDGIELGLSADTSMADSIKELHDFTYVTNSDSHSLPKIAREYQEMCLLEPSFKEFYYALHEVKGRSIVRNYGMNPQLGKYYTTVCQVCLQALDYDASTCSHCDSHKIVRGVNDRIQELKDNEETVERPPYIYQVPLEYIPGLGPKTFDKMLAQFETEMNIIHHADEADLRKYAKKSIVDMIMDMRNGKLNVIAGGGGKYGKVDQSK